MELTQSEYRQLQAKIDADAKAQTAKIEEERVQNHLALDRIWAMINRSDTSPATRPSLFPPIPVNGNGSDERTSFAMKHAIRTIIREWGAVNVTQPKIYKALVLRHSESISHRNQQHVKGQIAGVLTKMAESDPPELRVVEEGIGHNPKVYRATDNLK